MRFRPQNLPAEVPLCHRGLFGVRGDPIEPGHGSGWGHRGPRASWWPRAPASPVPKGSVSLRPYNCPLGALSQCPHVPTAVSQCFWVLHPCPDVPAPLWPRARCPCARCAVTWGHGDTGPPGRWPRPPHGEQGVRGLGDISLTLYEQQETGDTEKPPQKGHPQPGGSPGTSRVRSGAQSTHGTGVDMGPRLRAGCHGPIESVTAL